MVEIIEERAQQLIIRIGGQEYCRYVYGTECWKPYLFPLRASNGLTLIADSPTDHRHHHGFWVGHGRVNDTDCWLERHNSGKIFHRSFEKVASGEETGGFTEKCDWTATDGTVILTDTRTFTFHDTPPESRVFDFELVLRAPSQTPVQLHPTNEAGLPHIRAAEGLTVKTGGTITNASGQINERGTYRQPSPWLDCSGKLGRITCGIALFDHPDNPVYPTPWFTRDYGPISPNYILFQEDPVVVAPRRPLRLRYRVYTHSGDVKEGRVAEMYQQYLETVKQIETIAEPIGGKTE